MYARQSYCNSCQLVCILVPWARRLIHYKNNKETLFGWGGVWVAGGGEDEKLCPAQENLIKGNNTTTKQVRIKGLVYSTSSQCPLSFYIVSTNFLSFGIMPWTRKLNKGKSFKK